MRSGGRRVRPGSLGSLGCVLGVVRYIRNRWVNWGAPWGSSGSSGVIAVCTLGRRVIPGSLGSLGCALGVVGFISVLSVHLCVLWGS